MTSRTFPLALALAGALAFGACANAQTENIEKPVQRVQVEKFGPAGEILQVSLDSIALTDEQRLKIDQLIALVAEELEPARELKSELFRAVAAGVRHGQLDKVTLRLLVQRAQKLVDRSKQNIIFALNEAHAVLTPEQREELVAELRANILTWVSEREERPFSNLAETLGIDDDQRARMRSAIATRLALPMAAMQRNHRPHRRHRHWGKKPYLERLNDVAQAWIGPDFDAADLPVWERLNGISDKAELAMKAADIAMEYLDEFQRNTLADLLEERADRFGLPAHAPEPR